MKEDIKIQVFEVDIISTNSTQIKEALDKDYKYLVGIAIADGVCSDASIVESAKVKGMEFLPSDFEAVNIISSKAVEPDKRFFSVFNVVEISGEDLIIDFKDEDYSADYILRIQVLLTNHLDK